MHRFPIGTQYQEPGKYSRLCTVVDQLTTTNSKGEVVARRYTAAHSFLGQTVTTHDVVDTHIARNLLPAFKHLLK